MSERDSNNGSRTHQPDIQELTAEVDGIRELMIEKFHAIRELMDERHIRYSERDIDRQREVEKALTASDKQTASAFSASKEGIIEAKKAQDAYNLTHNDLVRKMERQASETMSRTEISALFRSVDEDIQKLKATVESTGGVTVGTRSLKDEFRSNVALLVSFGALAFLVWRALSGH